MASDIDFVNYVIEQIKNAGTITYKKMFGEYLIYSNGKPVIFVCDNTAFVKILDCVKPYMPNAQKGLPYKWAKEHYIVDIDDSERLSQMVREIEKVTPLPKKKTNK
ncbi:MAG: TfoX/Sxy family protein [Endomicrobium sp.]|jgi:TfoX/Sxy family transcriptional regulator of competence genes|nr:TfoX/Sxy family protein [Endomicrobium sp.]